MQSNNHADALHRLLTRPMRSTDICAALGISQPAFSRLSRQLPELVALGAARARVYAWARRLPGIPAAIPVAEISSDGLPCQTGLLHVFEGGWYALSHAGSTRYTLYQGLPPCFADLRPQGFLGRLEPRIHRDLDLPTDILRWSDEHVLQYLARRSEHAAGNLVLGEESLARYWEARQRGMPAPLPATGRASAYPTMAQAAMQGEPVGSSAGGEQPKFTCLLQTDEADGDDALTHVLVKFSPPIDTPGGRRWADLLVCEHLALATLHRFALPAAATEILALKERFYLEIRRFDRCGRYGRLPMVTLAALDGDLGMLDQSWTAVARVLHAQQQLSPEDLRLVEIIDLFGALIGNVDKHHGNLAVAWDWRPSYRLLPAYDMLPMLYRPNGHGEVVARAWNVQALRGMQLAHLPLCMEMATAFWQQVQDDVRISDDFKQLAGHHMAALAPLTCGGDTTAAPAAIRPASRRK